MSDNEKELKRILAAYVEFSRLNSEEALYLFKKNFEQILQTYKEKLNDNSNKT